MKRKILSFLCTAGLLACAIVPASADTIFEDTPQVYPVKASASISQLEQEACSHVNAIREANGLSSLTIDQSLCSGARIKSRDMNQRQYFNHTSPVYGTPFQMMKLLGISYTSAGENIAKGYTDAKAVVDAWMRSSSHRANILSSGYTSMGIGYWNGYWTQWFTR